MLVMVMLVAAEAVEVAPNAEHHPNKWEQQADVRGQSNGGWTNE
jgi:hypothetical protein